MFFSVLARSFGFLFSVEICFGNLFNSFDPFTVDLEFNLLLHWISLIGRGIKECGIS
ncbi:hypothetical protein LguiB_017407 [Lonicera macranthoides]